METIHRRFPRAFEEMRPTHNDVRRYLKENDLKLPPGLSLSDVPFVHVAPEFIRATKNFGIKIGCALHYKHAGIIVQKDWQIGIRLVTNTQLAKVGLEDFFGFMSIGAPIQRASNNLSDQFDYRFTVAIEKTVSAFVCRFRETFVIIVAVSATPLPRELMEDPERGAFLGGPFSHAVTAL